MIPPRGCLVKPSRGKSPLVPSSSGGMDSPQKGEIRSHLDFVSPPVFGLSLVARVLKNCYGMLNVLPPVVSVKRIHLHIVAIKCHRYRIWKNPAASSGWLPEQPGSQPLQAGADWRSGGLCGASTPGAPACERPRACDVPLRDACNGT